MNLLRLALAFGLVIGVAGCGRPRRPAVTAVVPSDVKMPQKLSDVPKFQAETEGNRFTFKDDRGRPMLAGEAKKATFDSDSGKATLSTLKATLHRQGKPVAVARASAAVWNKGELVAPAGFDMNLTTEKATASAKRARWVAKTDKLTAVGDVRLDYRGLRVRAGSLESTTALDTVVARGRPRVTWGGS